MCCPCFSQQNEIKTGHQLLNCTNTAVYAAGIPKGDSQHQVPAPLVGGQG